MQIGPVPARSLSKIEHSRAIHAVDHGLFGHKSVYCFPDPACSAIIGADFGSHLEDGGLWITATGAALLLALLVEADEADKDVTIYDTYSALGASGLRCRGIPQFRAMPLFAFRS